MFDTETASILGVITGVIATILMYILILPKRKDGNMDASWKQKLHDFFHFKKLYLEEVLKFCYVLVTLISLCLGVFTLVGYEEHWRYSYYGGSSVEKESTFLTGLLIIVFSPIFWRLVYESAMMFILLVKNTMDINNKLPNLKNGPAPAQPVYPQPPVQPTYPQQPVPPVYQQPPMQPPVYQQPVQPPVQPPFPQNDGNRTM